MIKITPLVLAVVVGGGLHLYKAQTSEVVVETQAPPRVSPNKTKEVRQCILADIKANLTQEERTAEEMELIVARKENEAHQFIPKGKGFAYTPLKANCMVKILGPGADVIQDASKPDLVE